MIHQKREDVKHFRLLDLPIDLRGVIGGYAAVTKEVLKIPRSHLDISRYKFVIPTACPTPPILDHDDHVSIHFLVDDWEIYLPLLQQLPNMCYLKIYRLPLAALATKLREFSPPVELRISLCPQSNRRICVDIAPFNGSRGFALAIARNGPAKVKCATVSFCCQKKSGLPQQGRRCGYSGWFEARASLQ